VNYSALLPDWVREPDPTLYVQGLPLFLDFETTNLDKGSALNEYNHLVLACYQEGYDGEMQHCWGTEYEQHELLRAVARCDFIVAHNAKFELQWLERCGVDLRKVIVYDTMLAEYVIGGNRWKTNNLSLETCLRRRNLPGKVSIVSQMIKSGICPSEIPAEWLLTYCERDVSALPQLMRKQLSVMEGTRLLSVLYSRCLLTPVLADIERNGMRLDPELVYAEHKSLKEQASALEAQINALTGGVPLVAGKQLATLLYDTLGFAEVMVKKGREWVPHRTDPSAKFPSGQRKTDSDTLSRLRATTSTQAEFLSLYVQLNDCRQALSKYMEKFLLCCEEANGHIQFDYNQTQTYTHRLSSNGRKYKVQGQNMPRDYKRLFRATSDDRVVGEADGAQLEFRVAAHMGRDDVALGDIRDGVDVHKATSSVLTANGQPTNRQDAKSRTFKPLYGGSSGTEAEKAYYEFFKQKYKGVAEAQQRWIKEVLMTKSLETEWGLRYYWPDTRQDRSGYITNTTAICNYPVQAFATAEIIPLGLVMLWHLIGSLELPIDLVNTIHDSFVAEIEKGYERQFVDVCQWTLTDGSYAIVEKLYGITLVCQLGCGVKIGSHWGEGEEVKHEGIR
jgi:DNA polymerase-1